jgi:prohibitin 2
MSIVTLYYDTQRGNLRWLAVARDAAILVLTAILLVAFWPLCTVPTGHRGVITVGGAIKGIEAEGFTLVAPWQQLSIFNIRAEQANIDKAEGATKDTQPVTTSLTVRYSVIPNKVAEVFEQYSHDGDLNAYINTATQEVFKAVTAQYAATDLIGQRAKVSNDISTALREKVSKYGAQIINIDMRQFSFSAEYMAAINDKVTQEQKYLAAEKRVLTVESEQKQKVAVAQAEATALKARADGEAYATLAAATAEAKAIQTKGEARAKAMEAQAFALIKNPMLVEMRKAEAWDGKLPVNMYAGAPIPFMNVAK